MPPTSDSFDAPHVLVIGEALVDVVLSPTAHAVLTTVVARWMSPSVWSAWDIPTPLTTGATLIPTGSIGSLLELGAAVVRRTFADAPLSTLLGFDPNIRPDVMGAREDVVPTVEALANSAHVVKMSDEDAEWLYPGRPHAEIADKHVEMSVALIGITRGSEGCYVRTAHHELEPAPPPVTVTDTIGAGDAFMSGLLHTLLSTNFVPHVLEHTLDRQALEQAARTALASAAITVSRAGANPPDRNERDGAIPDWFKTLP